MFSNRVASQIVTEFMTQKGVFEKDRELGHKAPGLEASKTIMDKDFNQAVLSVKNSFESLAATMGKPFMQPLTDAGNKLASLVNKADEVMAKDPNLAVHAGLGVAGATLGGTAMTLGALGIGGAATAAALPIMVGGAAVLGSSYYVTHAAQDPHNLPVRDLERREAANLYADQERRLEQAKRRGRGDKVAEIEDDMASTRYRMGTWRPTPIGTAGAPVFGGMGVSPFGPGQWVPQPGKPRKGTLAEALPDALPRTLQPFPHESVAPKEQQVNVKVHAEPMEIRNTVVVTSSDALLKVIEGAKEAARRSQLTATTGGVGSTDFGNQQQ